MADHLSIPARAGARLVTNRSLVFWLSPASLMIIAWSLIFVGSTVGLVWIDSFPILRQAMRNDAVEFSINGPGLVWLLLCLATFLAVAMSCTKPGVSGRFYPQHPRQLYFTVRFALLLHLLFSSVILLWVVLYMKEIGGPERLFSMLAEKDVYTAREVLLDNSLFTGMRLFFAGLVGLGTIGAGIVALNYRSSKRQRMYVKSGWILFLASIVILASLSVILSQRLLLVQLFLGAGIAAAIIRGRLFFAKWLPLVGLILFTVWSAREYVTVGLWDPDASAYRLGFERLIFYLINDLHNSLMPISEDVPHTYGFFTFRFAVFFSLTDDYFKDILAVQLEHLADFKGGGAFPIFAAPFVDFSYGGILVVAFIALLLTFVFNRAQTSFVYACIYGQAGAALVLSIHVPYIFEHDFVFNIIVTTLLGLSISPDRTSGQTR